VAPWAWRELDAEGALTSWSALALFVDWLVQRYDLGEIVPPCWWLHGAITEELTALWASWTAAYLDPDAGPDAQILRHERFGACRARIAESDRLGCAQRGHRDGPAGDWQLDPETFAEAVGADLAERRGQHRLFVVASPHPDEHPTARGDVRDVPC
jgi:hypothetical protein